jgi:hypothetical protein
MALPPTPMGGVPQHIPPIDLRRPERMPSLPAWAASRVASIRDEVQPDPATGKYRTAPTLPARLMMSEAERDEVERHVRELEASYGPTPADDPDVEGAMLIALTNLMMVLPAVKQNEASVMARGEAFQAALDDVPLWAVTSAIRRWHRGEGGVNERGQPYDYHWCPAPAELRRITVSEVWRLGERAAVLRKLLRAEPLIELAEEHCHSMRVRLSALMHETFGIPLVGKDGSGGTVGNR